MAIPRRAVAAVEVRVGRVARDVAGGRDDGIPGRGRGPVHGCHGSEEEPARDDDHSEANGSERARREGTHRSRLAREIPPNDGSIVSDLML